MVPCDDPTQLQATQLLATLVPAMGRSPGPGAGPQADPRLGRDVGGYALQGRAGQGGLFVVYKACCRATRRDVVVKMPRLGAPDAGYCRRHLADEAAALAQLLNASNVIRMVEFGEHEGEPFLVLEYVEGGTLEDRMERERNGRLPWQRVLALGGQVARGLAAVHSRGFMHRDVKPSNILLRRRGEAVVTDFGLARKCGGGNETEAVSGTPLYMAPEQARGEAVGPPVDIYSLGCTLYDALTGQPPFVGGTVTEVLHAHALAPVVPPHHLVPGLPVGVSELIAHRMLNKEPGRRFASCDKLLAALALYLPW